MHTSKTGKSVFAVIATIWVIKHLKVKERKVELTWLRCGGCRLLLGHVEDKPVAHPGLKALQYRKCQISMAKRTVAIFHFYFSYVSNVITACDASPSTRYRSSAASGFAGWPGRSRWTEAARSPVQSTFESLPSATHQHAGKECEARQCLQPTCMRSISCFSTLTMAVFCSFWRKGAFKLKLIIQLLNPSISN